MCCICFEETLNKPLIDHLNSRGMNPTLYSVHLDYTDDVITFYLWNLSGQITGYHQYRKNTLQKKVNHPKYARYYTYLTHGGNATFGVDLLDYSKPDLFIVEGIFKAAVLHRLGYNAIAVLTATPKQLRSLFRILRRRFNVVAIGDADSAGQSLVNIVGKGRCSPVDLDEMTDKEIEIFLKEFLT